MTFRTLLIHLLLLPIAASAAASDLEFKFLGPVLSHHSKSDEATLTPGVANSTCRPMTLTEIRNFYGGGSTFFVGGYPEKCEYTNIPAKKWNQLNAAIGLEISKRDDAGRTLVFVNAVRDSYYKPGLMLGAGRAWGVEFASGENFEVEWGVSAGIWNRHVMQKMINGRYQLCTNHSIYGRNCQMVSYWQSKVAQTTRKTIPFILPFVSVTHRDSGVGVNLSIIPKIKIGKYGNNTTTVVAQATYKF